MSEHHPDWLDHALQRQLPPPALPAGLTPRLHTALAQARQQRALDELRQRQTAREAELLAELARARAQLRQRRWRDSAQVLGVAVAVSFASGALAVWTLPWWQPWLDQPPDLVLPLVALALGVGSATLAARANWGRGWF
ncbi:hypothetical protein KAK07_19960 [Ideonella sp. 4Y16]|uniref:DUF2335 domain-containing protein n=1 Tax=Ideonella alba TaxID=2824118 RepID=A0A940YDC6_9BURK|nr:hypothetical protein [Ideonella alba]MBQ0932093.1 hypothetical protein [Ideonella alba]MBQ0945625.1 hypothetical protein [Ideonella alba]